MASFGEILTSQMKIMERAKHFLFVYYVVVMGSIKGIQEEPDSYLYLGDMTCQIGPKSSKIIILKYGHFWRNFDKPNENNRREPNSSCLGVM